MKKSILVTLIILLLLIAGALTVRFLLGGDEDAWLCVDGEWVKHGNPSAPKPETECGKIQKDCTDFPPDDCPANCVVCPPCPECSSISCQTEEFCAELGIDRSWYEEIKLNESLAENCQANGGRWLGQYRECEYSSQDWCEQSGGKFFECESACRHDPTAEICTLQCVTVCKFSSPEITSFTDCAAAGNPIMESYPRQCRADGQTFTENIGNELEKSDLIILDNPRPNQAITSPLTITGQARGYWYFEASFPVVLTDWDGLIIAQGIAQAQSDWMTEEFVPFEATLEFEKPDYGEAGSLILQKDNPSGLPEHDDALEIPIRF